MTVINGVIYFRMTFDIWLQSELDKRRWNRADLARAAGIHPSTLTNIYNGKRNAGGNILHKIAIGLDLPDEVVFHAYGMIRPSRDTDDIIEQVLYEMGGFKIRDKQEILEYVRMKRRIAEDRGEYILND